MRGEQLHQAIGRLDVNEVKELLAQDTDINLICEDGFWFASPLSCAKLSKRLAEDTIKELSYLNGSREENGKIVTGKDSLGHAKYLSKEEYAERLKKLKDAQKQEEATTAIIKLLQEKGAKEYERQIFLRD